MLQFFSMVVAAVIRFLLWFNKFTLFSNSFSLLTTLRLASRKTLLLILVPFVIIYFGLAIAFFYYFIDSILTVYNLVSAFLLKMQTMDSAAVGSPSILQPFFLFLNSSGFVTGFQSAFPFIAAALLFRLISILYRMVIKTNEKLLRFGFDIIKVITAA